MVMEKEAVKCPCCERDMVEVDVPYIWQDDDRRVWRCKNFKCNFYGILRFEGWEDVEKREGEE